MLDAFGPYKLDIQELIAQDDKVYVRWKQTGNHIGQLDEFDPSHKQVVEIASAVYRVEQQRIVEYWIQIDRLGMAEQLKRNQLG